MLRSNTRTFLLATCIAAAPAFALAQSSAQQSQQNQQTQTQQNAQRSAASGKFLAAPQSGQMRAADLRDADVYTADNQKVGEIDDILLDRQGRIIAVVVGVGGFLGIGEKNVAIPFDSLEIQDETAASASADRDKNRSAANSNAANANRAANADRSSNADRMATGAVPDNRAATDQDRQRTTAQRAEQMSAEQANRQNQNAAAQSNQRTADKPNQRTGEMRTAMWKPERILLKGVTKADLQNAPEFNWDEDNARSRSNSGANAPARNR